MAEDTRSATEDGRYKLKEDVWFDDGREEELLSFVKSRCHSQGAVETRDILRFIDDFGISQRYMMNVGAEKGNIVSSLISRHKPATMVELGGYVGYSTLLFADALRRNGGKSYISFEREPKFARIAQAFVSLAGLSDVVRIVVGSSSSNLVEEHRSGRLGNVDMIFLDHYKPAYVRDLKICESLGIIQPHTVIVADNVITPGNPPYLEYVRGTPSERQQRQKEQMGQFPERTTNQYKRQYDADDTELPGIPGILYESRLIESHEPTGEPDGLEVTVCKSVPLDS